jgi:uncharacterized protein (DUF2141 family)
MYKSLLRITFFIVILALSCARQLSPSGGPDDKTGPSVASIIPKAESVNVPVNSHVIIDFSEWISTKSSRSVSIFPPVPFQVKIAGKRLEIIPRTIFSDSTTYHIVITSILQDLHNNSITTPLSIVFSTGPSLDSGSIRGCVNDPSRQNLQPKVALFRAGQKSDTVLFGIPSYLVQTDSSGFFKVNHIRSGLYRVIAFVDANGDSRFQPVKEQLYLPQDSAITINGTVADSLIFFPAESDTGFPKITEVKEVDKRIVIGKWDRVYDTTVFSPLSFSCESTEKSKQVKIKKSVLLATGREFAVILDDTLSKQQYKFIYKIGPDSRSQYIDTVNLNGTGVSDTSRAVLRFSSPLNNADLQPLIRFVWSKPVLLCDSIIMRDSTGDSVSFVSNSKGFSDTTEFKSLKRLLPGKKYKVAVLDSFGKDLGGKFIAHKDSTDTSVVFTITTIEADSLAGSVRGGMSCSYSDPARKWIFKLFNKPGQYISNDSSGNFFYESIPAGKGSISYFSDRNGNGVPDKGKLFPWKAPEPFYSLKDTIEARARWDVEGISVSACKKCGR